LLFDDIRKIERHVKNFLDYLYEVSHLSPKMLISYYDAVKRFYKSNRITLQGYLKDYVGTVNIPTNFDMPCTYEEIHRMLDKAGERQRCIILLLCSGGLRREAVSQLKYSDPKWVEQYGIYEIAVYKGFKEEYKTYCSLECASAINSYLDYRKRYGKVIIADSYIIRKQFDASLHSGKIKMSDATNPPEKHTTSSLPIEGFYPFSPSPQYLILSLLYTFFFLGL
jgi:integrase